MTFLAPSVPCISKMLTDRNIGCKIMKVLIGRDPKKKIRQNWKKDENLLYRLNWCFWLLAPLYIENDKKLKKMSENILKALTEKFHEKYPIKIALKIKV